MRLGRTPRELLEGSKIFEPISSLDLTELQAFDILEPYGVIVDFYKAAIIASTIANVNRKKGKAAIKPEVFLPEFGKGIGEIPYVQSADEIKHLMMGLVRATDPKRKKKRRRKEKRKRVNG